MRIKKNDQVLVLSGRYRGKQSRVLKVDAASNTVKVEGVNIVKKHVRRSRRNPQGGMLTIEMPIPVSNVQLVCPVCGKRTRIGVRFAGDGSKFRVCKKCNADISQVSPAREKR
ncbi:MAG: 50S ribosomal protein L24 [Planctomycetaceae bacterium]|jgi:large subunit ribosomal protein L24|nr:50S ribosomal protein L24 [Planctomycetaceae bacterium]